MRPDSRSNRVLDLDLIPFFGCAPHAREYDPDPSRRKGTDDSPGQAAVADPPLTRRRRKRKAKGKLKLPCPACGGAVAVEGSEHVCMTCHGVAPEYEELLAVGRQRAARSREPEWNTVGARADEIRARRKGRRGRQDVALTQDERRVLCREFPDLARQWLDSIGQPAPDDSAGEG